MSEMHGNRSLNIPEDLPIPPEQLFYADPVLNDQEEEFRAFITHIHYPTLGCPALIQKGEPLRVLVSLPGNMQPDDVYLDLLDRHGGRSETFALHGDAPHRIGKSPSGLYTLYLYRLDTGDAPCRLYDLNVRFVRADARLEVQRNAVRIFAEITGQEKVLLSGDAQYNVSNERCLREFVKRVNDLAKQEDIAWVTMIGDVCDNGVKSVKNLLKLGARMKSRPVTCYYREEYEYAHLLLEDLEVPIFLLVGNHDGMAAYRDYVAGTRTQAYLGPDPKNTVAYDGLHHYRRTFGPLYYHFDWAQTRYLCVNSFELDRHDRLGYHAIVANWGGHIRPEQHAWLERELVAAGDRTKVVLLHHDPRGGSKGKKMGLFHDMRRFNLKGLKSTLAMYIPYIWNNYKRHWQQEWMAPRDTEIARYPVRDLLQLLIDHEVWSVIMGHDDVNWLDTYGPADERHNDILATPPAREHFAPEPELPAADPDLVAGIRELWEEDDLDAVVVHLEEVDDELAASAVAAALDEILQEEEGLRESFTTVPKGTWTLRPSAPMHFLHVTHIGSYSYKDKDMDNYGVVVAELGRGAPTSVQNVSLGSGTPGRIQELEG